jgi:hypothetical protein
MITSRLFFQVTLDNPEVSVFRFTHADEYRYLDVRLMGTISTSQVGVYPLCWVSLYLMRGMPFQVAAGSAYWICAGLSPGDGALETLIVR